MSDGATPALVLGRYDADDLLGMFEEAGILDTLASRGFGKPAFEVDASGGALVHARLRASKYGVRHLLFDACLTQVQLVAGQRIDACTVDAPADLLVVYWLREQDPTATFTEAHPHLPLQDHPGLGVLRRAFRVAVRMAKELDKDGVAALPKFFHDAAIFYRSRLFLFLDPREQGCLEALLRDLAGLSLADATLAFIGDAIRDAEGDVFRWHPTLQVLPMSSLLTERFHSPAYQAACREAFESLHFACDPHALARARRVFEGPNEPASSGAEGPAGA